MTHNLWLITYDSWPMSHDSWRKTNLLRYNSYCDVSVHSYDRSIEQGTSLFGLAEKARECLTDNFPHDPPGNLDRLLAFLVTVPGYWRSRWFRCKTKENWFPNWTYLRCSRTHTVGFVIAKVVVVSLSVVVVQVVEYLSHSQPKSIWPCPMNWSVWKKKVTLFALTVRLSEPRSAA